MKEDNNRSKFGVVQIRESVIVSIAGLAATDVKGVKALVGGIEHNSITHSNDSNLAKAIRVSIADGKLAIRVAVILDGTVGIPEVAKALQEKVKNSVEVMTGNTVDAVEVVIQGVEE